MSSTAGQLRSLNRISRSTHTPPPPGKSQAPTPLICTSASSHEPLCTASHRKTAKSQIERSPVVCHHRSSRTMLRSP
ncbi:hypothetical protein B0H67DRAFT_570296 [Lasiosphaeris hirsuta]|uniref:Uncharacterized protein n=1 Tax=Lasiosphaeris hirsuta TaxID=260670 RepID=A0AA40B0N6_9PEZI|nr:hypothetical protein B0H67DRAFT_570296 [Lasiosphaeris hirsuta]